MLITPLISLAPVIVIFKLPARVILLAVNWLVLIVIFESWLTFPTSPLKFTFPFPVLTLKVLAVPSLLTVWLKVTSLLVVIKAIFVFKVTASL